MTANPTLLAMPLAKNGQKNTIPTTQATPGNGLFSQSTGFPAETSLPLGAGGVAPSREDFNGMAYLLGGVAYYVQKGWQFQFDAGQEYFAGCIVRDTTDGKLYECLNDVAAGGVVPSADSANWKNFPLGGVQVGFIAPYAGSGLPDGWLICDGSAVSRTLYSALFSAIGTTYGAGDGSTTFNLPDEDFLKGMAGGRVPVVAGSTWLSTTGAYVNATLKGKQLGTYYSGANFAAGAYNGSISYDSTSSITGANLTYLNTSAGYSPWYADLSSVSPQYSSAIRYLIKYE